MIGISLAYDQLLDITAGKESDEILMKIWELGARSIELRTVPENEDPANVFAIATLLWDMGFNVTIHANASAEESAVESALFPLRTTLENMRQRELIVTLHPIIGNNTAMLISLSDYANEHNYPVRIALENERKMPDMTDGDSLSLALGAVVEANRENVGICFDFGHLAWYYDARLNDPERLPPEEFLSRAIHTHIHECVNGDTHYPIVSYDGVIPSYIAALGSDYRGIYNIELSPERFTHLCSAEEGYITSLRVFSAANSALFE